VAPPSTHLALVEPRRLAVVPFDAKERAAALGISLEAAELYAKTDVIDLHVDSFI